MKFLQKRQNERSFTKSEYVVLSYEQLLQVNGAGGSSSGGGGPSGPSGGGSSSSSFSSSTTSKTSSTSETAKIDTTFDGTKEEYLGTNLTDEEVAFIIANPFDTIEIYNNSKKASETYSGHNDIGDAKRHAFWSAMNAIDTNLEDAMEYGYAHEDFEGNTEGSMDIYNNQIGWQIAIDNPGASDTQLQYLVEEAAQNGLLKSY